MSIANATRIDDLPGGDMGMTPQMPAQQQLMPPIGGSMMGGSPPLPAALQPIATSVHDTAAQQQQSPFQQPQQFQQPPQFQQPQAPTYNPSIYQTTQSPQQQMSSDAINQIMYTINQGGTQIPSRDIPMMCPTDEQARPNYMPNNGGDYVQQYADYAEIARKNKEKEEKQRNKDDVFDKLQVPILCSILFFVFQLPVIRKSLFKFLPSFFFTDGNPKISALLTQTLIFAAGIYALYNFIIVS